MSLVRVKGRATLDGERSHHIQCQSKNGSTFVPSSTSWNSWYETTPKTLSQTNRFYPDVVETHGEPNIPNAHAAGTRHGSPNGDSEDAADSVTLRGQQRIRNGVQPLLSITLSMANSGTITPQISQDYE